MRTTTIGIILAAVSACPRNCFDSSCDNFTLWGILCTDLEAGSGVVASLTAELGCDCSACQCLELAEAISCAEEPSVAVVSGESELSTALEVDCASSVWIADAAIQTTREMVIAVSTHVAGNALFHGTGGHRLLSVLPGMSVSIDGLNFENGTSASFGGCLLAGAGTNLSITNVTFRNCHASFGGAIAVWTDAVVDLSRTTIVNSSAEFYGGGLYAYGAASVSLVASTVVGCFVWTPFQGRGGGVYSIGTVSNSIVSVRFEKCSSTLYAGGAMFEEFGLVGIEDTIFSGCNAAGSPSAGCGGLYVITGSFAWFERTTFEDCTAESFSGAFTARLVVNTLHLIDVDVKRCSAGVNAGGAILASEGTISMDNVSFEQCATVDEPETETDARNSLGGGGLLLLVLEFSLIRRLRIVNTWSSTFGGCLATTKRNLGFSGVFDTMHLENCSAMLDGGAARFDRATTVQVTRSVVRNSFAEGKGGGFDFEDIDNPVILDATSITRCAASFGGGIALFSSTLRLVSSKLTANNASVTGGAVYASASSVVHSLASRFIRNTAAAGGAVALEGSEDTRLLASENCSFVTVEVTDVSANDLGFALVRKGHSASSAVDAKGDPTIDFFDETASNVLGHFCLSPATYELWLSDRTGAGWQDTVLSVSAGNRSQTSYTLDFLEHGARVADIEIDVQPVANIGPMFEANVASDSGGAIALMRSADTPLSLGPTAVLVDVDFVANVAISGFGGAAWVDVLSTFNVTRGNVSSNRADSGSGGFVSAWQTASVVLRDINGTGNSALNAGFAHLSGVSRFYLVSSWVEENIASGNGGALALFDVGDGPSSASEASVVVDQSTFVANECGQDGGAMFVELSTIRVLRSQFFRNVAWNGNGGLFAVSAPPGEVASNVGVYFATTSSISCRDVSVVMDWRYTTSRCSPYNISLQPIATCDYNTNACGFSSRATSTEDICDGCSCSSNLENYYQESPTGIIGAPSANGAWVDTHCLEPNSTHQITAYSSLATTWWGGTLEVIDTESRAVLASTDEFHWLPSGTETSPIEFRLPALLDAVSIAVENSAPNGGGGVGFVFYSDEEEEEEESDQLAGLEILSSNFAGYGDAIATPAASLDCGSLLNFHLRSGEALPKLECRLLDARNALVVTEYDARVTTTTAPGLLSQEDTAFCEAGVCTFDSLTLFASEDVENVTIELTVHIDSDLTVATPKLRASVVAIKDRKEDKHFLSRFAIGLLWCCVIAVAVSAAFCSTWTWKFRDRMIVKVAQPLYMHAICAGAVISTASIVPDITGITDFGCRANLALFGAGFVLTASTLYSKLANIEHVIEAAITFGRAQSCPDFVPVATIMVVGEIAVITAWMIEDPLVSERDCLNYESSHLTGSQECDSSVRRCECASYLFLILLSCWHLFCYGAAFHMCYHVRNVPSVVCDGRWVFTALFAQLQSFIIVAPVLYVLRNNPTPFLIIKSLVVAATELSTLFVVFAPKIRVVRRYGDFDSALVAAYIEKTMAASTQIDHVYDMLAVSPPPELGEQPASPQATNDASPTTDASDRKNYPFETAKISDSLDSTAESSYDGLNDGSGSPASSRSVPAIFSVREHAIRQLQADFLLEGNRVRRHTINDPVEEGGAGQSSVELPMRIRRHHFPPASTQSLPSPQ